MRREGNDLRHTEIKKNQKRPTKRECRKEKTKLATEK